ncbi:MAG: D-alanyl-lipoteichoic acid biosynthesis protein DltD [Fluviicola sp.]
MKLEKYISKFYRFSTLKEVGKTGALALAIVTLFGLFAFLFLRSTNDMMELPKNAGQSFLTVDATHVKNDDAYFHEFMHRIRKNEDYLVLGTSESGYLDGYNYWELLNADSSLEHQFSVLYGAGRFCQRYIPSMINNPEIWRNQKLIVIINPVYWREGLSRFSLEYHERYMNESEVKKARDKSDRKEDFDLLFGGSGVGFAKGQMNQANNWIEKNIHELYYGRLHQFFGLEGENIAHYTPHSHRSGLQARTSPELLEQAKSEVLDDFNCTQEFINTGDYLMTELFLNSKYRNTALDYFLELCKELNVQPTFVIGPYNKTLTEKNGQEAIAAQYAQLYEDLKSKLNGSGFPYIDATAISDVPHSFIDKQHHSKYGGYLMYQTIKSQLYE